VTEADIAEVISSGRAFRSASWLEEKLLQLEDELHQVIGQNEAVSAVADAIQRSREGLLTESPHR